MKKKYWLGVIISIGMLIYFFNDVKPGELWSIIVNADYIWVLPIFFVNIISIAIRSFRWKYFFGSDQKVDYWSMFSATAIGFMANNILPARMGEVLRAYLLAKKTEIKGSTAFATIVTERVFDFVSVLMLFGLFAIYNTFMVKEEVLIPKNLIIAGWICLSLSLIALFFLILLRFRSRLLIRIADFILSRVFCSLRKRVIGMIEAFVKGLEILTDIKSIIMAFILSMGIWTIFSFSIYALFIAFDMPATIPGSFFLLIVLAVSTAIPSGPGFVGTFDVASEWGLQILGIVRGAKAFTLILHASSYISITALGLIVLAIEGISLKELKKGEELALEAAADSATSESCN